VGYGKVGVLLEEVLFSEVFNWVSKEKKDKGGAKVGEG